MSARAKKECVVLVASPSAFIRKRLKAALQQDFLVYAIPDANGLERKLITIMPSVLLLDVALSSGGIELLPAIQELSPSTKIVLLTNSPNQKEAVRALESCAKGYADANMDPVLIRKTVRMVQKGEVWLERKVIPYLVKELAECKRKPEKHFEGNPENLKLLTTRQQQIATLISQGASNKEIAHDLKITEATVKAHIHTIFRKLAVSDRLGLAILIRDISRDLTITGHFQNKASNRLEPNLKKQ